MRIMAAVLFTLTVLTLVFAASTTAAPEPSPSTVPAPPPFVVTPASPAVVHGALRARHLALRARTALSRAEACLGYRVAASVKRAPSRLADSNAWSLARAGWERQRQTFNRRTAHLVHLMRNPGGSGAARWWPLCLWTGWRPSLKSWFIYVCNRESHGQEHAQNPSSGCYGLLQEIGTWWAAKGRRWIADPENQLRLGWHIYCVQGPGAWSL